MDISCTCRSTAVDRGNCLTATWTRRPVSTVVLPLWILFGNLLVLLSVIGFRHLRTLSNWVIASLAFTDFLLALTVVPFGIYQLVNGSWDLGLTACLFWTGSDVFLSTTSIMHLCAIAIHRHLGIAYPLRMRRGAQNRRHVLCLLLPAWTLSAAVSASLVVQGAMDRHSVLVPVNSDQDRMACGIYDHTFAIYSSMLSFFVPLAVMVAVDVRSVQILRSTRRRDVFAATISMSSFAVNNPSRDISSYNVSSPVPRESITAVELTIPSSSQALPSTSGSQAVITGEKSTFLRPRCDTHPCSAAGPDAGDRANRRSTMTPHVDDVISTQQSTQRPVKPDHLRVHTGTGTGAPRASRGFIRFPTAGRNSLGAVKMHGRERRAGRTLIWVFAIFVALWLPFFCTNLAYGLCGTQYELTGTTTDNSTTTTTTTTMFDSVEKSTFVVVGVNRTAADTFGGSSDGCDIPESVFIAFTWLGYLSSGVNPLVYTLLNHDFQNAFRTIITCRYISATSASRRQSRANLFS